MGMTVILTCKDCNHKGVPTLDGDGFHCKSCTGNNFTPVGFHKKPKGIVEVCDDCGYDYYVNDCGCPRCYVEVSVDRLMDRKKEK